MRIEEGKDGGVGLCMRPYVRCNTAIAGDAIDITKHSAYKGGGDWGLRTCTPSIRGEGPKFRIWVRTVAPMEVCDFASSPSTVRMRSAMPTCTPCVRGSEITVGAYRGARSLRRVRHLHAHVHVTTPPSLVR